jgi:hypothetical protein
MEQIDWVFVLTLAASLALAIGAMCVPVLRDVDGRVIDRADTAVAIALSVLSVVFLSIALSML